MNDFEKIEYSINKATSEIFETFKSKYGYEEYSLKKDLTPLDFGERIYSCLKECLAQKIDPATQTTIPAITFSKRCQNFLRSILVETSFDYFREAINAFERLVNTENVYSSTDLYRSIILKAFGSYDLKSNEKKIDYICSSPVLTAKNNLCDNNKIKDKGVFLSDFYSRHAIDALAVMSKFHNKKNIVENYFPSNLSDLSGFEAFFASNPVKLSQVNISKIPSEVIFSKFNLSFLMDLQSELSSGRLKKDLNNFISSQISEKEKIKLLISPLFELNMKKFKVMEKLYPGIFEIITKEIFDSTIKVDKYHLCFVNDNEETQKAAKKYSLTVKMGSRLKAEDVWKIIVHEKSLREKKAIKKSLNTKTSSTIKTKKRI